MNLADDVVFAGIDLAGGYKSPEQVGNELGKKALSSAVSVALAGAGSFVNGLNAVKGLTGIAKTAFNVGKTGVEGVISTTLNTGIQAMDFSKIGTRDFFDDRQFISQMGSLNTWSGTISAMGGSAVSGGLGMLNLGNVDGFNSLQIGQIGSLNGFAGSMASTAIGYGITGNASFNLVRLNGTGLLEMNLGKDGFNMQLGMGGTDISLGRISGALAGASHWNKNIQIEKAAKWDGLGNAATALRAQYGFGDGMQRAQLESILKGDTVLAKRAGKGSDAETVTKDGKRTVYLDNYKETMSREEKLAMGITLGHEAYRDGLVGSEQQQFMETTRAVLGHTEMALRMQSDQRYSESMDSIIGGSAVLQKDIAAYKSGDLMTMLGHVAGNYDWSKDYWKLKLDGTLEAEYDKNGKLITDLNVEYLDVGGNLQKRLHIKDDTESGSRSLARYVGEERAREILKKSFDDIATYDVQTLKDVFKLTDNQIIALRHDPGMKSLNFDSLPAETKERLIGEALLKKHGMDWQGNKWTGNEKFSLAMSDIKDLGQIVINKNADGSYERFAIRGVVERNILSRQSVRKQDDGSADYQGLDVIKLYKNDLNGNTINSLMSISWQTVANGYANKDHNIPTSIANEVYRAETVAPGIPFSMRFGNFSNHIKFGGKFFVLNSGSTIGSLTIDRAGNTGPKQDRLLGHSNYLYGLDRAANNGLVSAGCFMNTMYSVDELSDWVYGHVKYPYDVRTILKEIDWSKKR